MLTNCQDGVLQSYYQSNLHNKWKYIKQMPYKVRAVASGVICDQLYVAGGGVGTDGNTGTKRASVYNPVTDSWKRIADLPYVVVEAASGVICGKLYLAGGYVSGDGNQQTKHALVYNPETDSWKRIADLPYEVTGAAAGVICGKLYVVGGFIGSGDNQKVLKNVLVYNPVTDSWKRIADLPYAVGFAAAGVICNKLYLAGGIDALGNTTKNSLVYNPTSDSWKRIKELPYAVYGSTPGVICGRLYVVGGIIGSDDISGDIVTNQGLVYNPVTDSWKPISKQKTTTAVSASGVICNKLYVVGGELNSTNSTNNPVTNSAQVYF